MLATIVLLTTLAAVPAESDYFRITVVDDETGRGVPLVELRTVNQARYFTDSAGVVAYYEPGLMGRKVFFFVDSHGYEFRQDGFGNRGKALRVEPGGQATLRLRRINVAERLYRVTGSGVYRDSTLLGDATPVREPLLNGMVLGSDSVVNAVFKGRIYWFWGDTNRPGYPLGNFHVPGAVSLLPESGGLDPDRGVDLEYFLGESGFAKPTCAMPGKGPTWINGLVVVPDASGRDRLFAAYVKVEPPLKVYERGLAEFNDEKQVFQQRQVFPLAAPLFPQGHPFLHTSDGVTHAYFGDPYPLIRVPATAEALQDLELYEAWTCLAPGSRADDVRLDRDAESRLRFSWKRDTMPLTLKQQKQWTTGGRMIESEAFYGLKDVETGEAVVAHRGSVRWNAYKKCWIMIFVQQFGSSLLGEVWYAEAPAPVGPWTAARKIATHERYSFYNPKQHAMFDQQGGRFVYFEGTYTNTFSGNPEKTPRYNYNQIMYRLDLADPRLEMP